MTINLMERNKMSSLVGEMLSGLVVYVWNNPLDDNDLGAVLIKASDFSEVQEISGENIGDSEPGSFLMFLDQLARSDVPYHDISENVHMYVYTE